MAPPGPGDGSGGGPPGGGDGGGGGGTGGDDPPCGAEGANFFTVHDGNAKRSVNDLAIPGAAMGSLSWTRLHSTVPADIRHFYFGMGGSWRPSWQYDLIESPTADHRLEYELTYPSGVHRAFRPDASGTLSTAARFDEQIARVADGFDITTPDNSHLHFTRVVEAAGKQRYELRTITDPHGLVTQLSYNDGGYLTQIVEPAGRQLQLVYQNVAFQSGRWKKLAAIGKAPAPGESLEFAIPEAFKSISFRYLRVLTPKGGPLAIADVQFFAPGSSKPLNGTAKGTGIAPESAFDANSATVFRGTQAGVNLCSLDLGANASLISRIRILAAPGEAAALVGVAIEGLVLQPDAMPVLARVTGSNGESVSYTYEISADPFTAHEHVVLAGVSYAGGSKASYHYAYPSANQQPLLTEADDPNFVGRAKRIRYTYQNHKNVGMIHEEINPATGGVYASLELDPAQPDKRTVRYSDLRQVSYLVSADAQGRVTERTDALGRKTRFEYADQGKGRLLAETDHLGRRFERALDQHGKIKSVVRDQKQAVQFERDTSLQIVKATDRFNRTSTLERDAQGRIARIHTFDGAVQEIGRDGLGRIISLAHTDRGMHHFAYNAQGLKSVWINPRGGKTAYEYDAQGRCVTVTDPLGRVSHREVDARGLTTKLIAADGHTRTFIYDSYARKTAETDVLGRTTQFTYDDLGRVTRTIDPVGRATTFDYTELPQGCGSCNLAPNPTRIVDVNGRVTQNLYDAEGRLLARTENAGTAAQATTTYTYDDDDNLIAVTDSLNRTTRHTFDDEHRTLTTTDAASHTTYLAYDNHGNLVTSTAADGSITRSIYDKSDRRVTTIDALGNVTKYTYDALGLITSMTDATGAITRFVYDGRLLTSTTYSDGTQQTSEYDLLGRVTRSTSPQGLVTRFTYDNGGRVLATSDNTGRATSNAYDILGHRTASTDPLNRVTRWTYDAHGNVLTTTRPDGAATANTFDAQDHLISAIDAAGQTTRYAYDSAGNMTALTDAKGNTYRFTYDGARRKTAMVYPDGSKETSVYDSAGQLITYTNRAGQNKALAYNNVGQPLTETWSPTGAAPSVSYAYDPAGRLASIDNTQATLSYAYDASGRQVSETSNVQALVPGLLPNQVSYAYDELGRRKRLIYPDGAKVEYAYDVYSRLTTIDKNGNGKPLAEYGYDILGRIAKVSRDNGVETRYQYDMAGQLTDLVHANGSQVLASSHYALDVLGRRTAQTREDSVSEKYGYDTTSQLTSVDYGASPAKRESFVYDPIGNRTSATYALSPLAANLTPYTTNALNQYTSVGGTKLVYDANGNLLNDGKQSYAYDAQNHLIAVEGASTRAEFYYDPRNRCVLRKYYTKGSQSQWVLDQAQSRALTYDGQWNLLAERTLDGTLVGDYMLGLRTDEILISHVNSQTVCPLTDGLGSTVALTDIQGKVTDRFRYDAFGQPRAFTAAYKSAGLNSSTYRFLFTGREWLNTFSLNDNRNRYYCPALARWLTADPLGFRGADVNIYRYVYNDAVGRLDSSGLSCWCGERAAQVLAVGVDNALLASQLRYAAEADTASSGYGDWTNGYSWTDGRSDAYRHCIWSCYMAVKMGPIVAEKIGTTHEECTPASLQNPKSEAMDLINNFSGRQLTTSGKAANNAECQSGCRALLDGGVLTVINK